MTKEQEQEVFKKAMELLDVKEGDKVKILKEWPSRSLGWGTIWAPRMKGTVGKVFEVQKTNTDNFYGVGLSNGYNYPPYVLERVTDSSTPYDREHIMDYIDDKLPCASAEDEYKELVSRVLDYVDDKCESCKKGDK